MSGFGCGRLPPREERKAVWTGETGEPSTRSPVQGSQRSARDGKVQQPAARGRGG